MSKDETQNRWYRRAPISGMSIEEIKRRVAQGIKNRQRDGRLQRPDLKVLKTQASGPTLDKKQRRVLIRASELAVYSLANAEQQDYCQAATVINSVRRQAGYETSFMQHFLKAIAEQAAEISGEPFPVLDNIAKAWLTEYYTPSNKLISIVEGKKP